MIGDVNILTGVGATNLGKAEDAAHTSGDTGVMILGVRQDALTPLAGSTGDYIPITVDALGRQYVAGISGANAGAVAILTLTSADTEYTVNIPSGTRKVEFTCRSAAKTPATSAMNLRIAWATGQVAAGSGNCKTITADKEYKITDHIFTAATAIYFASGTAGVIVEMCSYS